MSRPDGPTPPPLVDWMGGGRGGGSSFLSRGYSYNVDPDARVVADGLVRVPIQVWSTKAFTANWSGFADKGTPLIAAELSHPTGDPAAVHGSFVNNLPVGSLQDPILFYAGQAYKLPTLTPGQRVSIPATGVGSGLTQDGDWLSRNAHVNLTNLQSGNNQWGGRTTQTATTSSLSLWGMLFHERAAKGDTRSLNNATMRDLDQSWRLDENNRNEAILVARVETVNGQANDILSDPAGASPTKLWLKGLPQPGANPPVIPGTLRQETYIRVYIPIAPAERAGSSDVAACSVEHAPTAQDTPDTTSRCTTRDHMIETRDLTKKYGDLYALDRLTLKLDKGDVFGFIGPNGAGKTTTMRILATLLNPSWGEASVCGYSIYTGSKEIRRAIGYMPDFFGVYDDMKVIEYLEFFAAAYRIKGPERRKKCEQVLELVDLGYKRDALVTSLSRGMTQRLGLARVLLHEPQVLLLDEPASGLDPRARSRCANSSRSCGG